MEPCQLTPAEHQACVLSKQKEFIKSNHFFFFAVLLHLRTFLSGQHPANAEYTVSETHCLGTFCLRVESSLSVYLSVQAPAAVAANTWCCIFLCFLMCNFFNHHSIVSICLACFCNSKQSRSLAIFNSTIPVSVFWVAAHQQMKAKKCKASQVGHPPSEISIPAHTQSVMLWSFTKSMTAWQGIPLHLNFNCLEFCLIRKSSVPARPKSGQDAVSGDKGHLFLSDCLILTQESFILLDVLHWKRDNKVCYRLQNSLWVSGLPKAVHLIFKYFIAA